MSSSDPAPAPEPAPEQVPSTGSAAGPAPVPARRNRRLVVWMAAIAVTVALVDQLTKYWAERVLAGHGLVEVIGEVIQFRLIYNPGAAFSIASGMTWLLTLIVVVVVVVILRASSRIGSRGWAVALGLLLGGAVGNLVDRLFRQPGFPQGHVVDFIDYAGWFVGNVADIAVVCGAGLIGLLTLRGIGIDGTRATGHRKP
ncbi:MAG TPA: signal peptidase II [Jiangellaceae bacterium]